MHNASTKQRLSALRRRLGIFTGWQPRWVKERRRRLERLARSAGSAMIATVAPPPGDEEPTEIAHAHDRLPCAVPPEPERPAPPPPMTVTPALPLEAMADTATEPATPAATLPTSPESAGPTDAALPRVTQVEPATPTEAEPVRSTRAEPGPPADAKPPRRTYAAPASATHATPARAMPPATLAAPARRRTGGAARGAAVALALVALGAAGILALGRRGANAPAVAPELERAGGRDGVVLATAPTPAPAPAAAPLARGPRGDERAIAPDLSVVQVRPGDTLWRLAAVHLGDPMRWPELHAANSRLIRDPDLIFPGQQLDVPRSAHL